MGNNRHKFLFRFAMQARIEYNALVAGFFILMMKAQNGATLANFSRYAANFTTACGLSCGNKILDGHNESDLAELSSLWTSLFSCFISLQLHQKNDYCKI